MAGRCRECARVLLTTPGVCPRCRARRPLLRPPGAVRPTSTRVAGAAGVAVVPLLVAVDHVAMWVLGTGA